MELSSERVLIVLHGSIGDVVRAIPLAVALKRHRPSLKIVWSVEQPSASLLEGHPAIDEVIVFDRPRWVKACVGYLTDLRNRKFDIVLDLQRHFKSGLISCCTRAPVRVGFARSDAKESNWLFNTIHIPARSPRQSKLSMYLEFGRIFGISVEPVEWKLSLGPLEGDRVAAMLSGIRRPFAAFFVGSSWPSKRWTVEATTRIIDWVRDRWHLDSVLLGADSDVRFARSVAALSEKSMRNLVGQTSLRDLIGIFQQSAFSLGPDTGAMHISAAVGTPVVSLWAPTDPEWSGPFGHGDLMVKSSVECGPCMKRVCKQAGPCMGRIPLDQVMTKIEMALKKRGLA